jgi:PhoH-like ATPase
MKDAILIDTSVLIDDPESVKKFSDTQILIPIYVIMELDLLKDKKASVSHLARKSSNLILEEIEKGNIEIVSHEGEVNMKSLDKASEIRYIDILILKTAEKYKQIYNLKVVTKDVNLRILCAGIGVEAEDYICDSPKAMVIETITRIEPSSEAENSLVKSYWEGSQSVELGKTFPVNHFIFYERDDKKFLFRNGKKGLIAVDKKKVTTEKVKPRNLEQTAALELLLNPEIKLVCLFGKAGTGKTFLALASAIHQNNLYHKILLSKPVVDVGSGIGFLPGTLSEKMEPWMQSFFDNLDQIDPLWEMNDRFMEKNRIEVQPINSIRGRSLKNSFMIIDEAQNLSRHEIKSIITRAAEGTKVVLLGDVSQIDNPYLDEKSNGLVYVSERMRGQEIFGCVSLSKSERSSLSDLAADLL